MSIRLGDRLRDRHAAERLRSRPAFRRLMRAVDFPVWRRVAGGGAKVRVRWLQHLSYYATSYGPEAEVAALMIAMVRLLPVRTFVDVGANFGYYAWLLDDHSPRALEVHLFEPDPGNQQLIRATQARRAPMGGTLHPVALAATDGWASFYRDLATGHRGSVNAAAGLARAIQVPTRRLDSVLRTVGPTALLKVDVEGAEEGMLTGSRELLRCQPLVVLECFHHGDDAAWRRLAALPGYRLLDASTADDISESTTNYVAFPPQVHPEVVGRVVRERCRILESGRLPAPTTLRRMAALEPALQSGP